ncbi:MAG: hypothetical protein K940chlam9_00628 [Chlamydiae bacterium]|nr:hypothetical protein [Chlamydiota bacterium]
MLAWNQKYEKLMAEKSIIGRKAERRILKEVSQSKEAEFLAIYGRRRVGKTYLIREYFSNKGIYFETAGVKDLSLHEQLENFAQAISKTFFNDVPIKPSESWKEAFALLSQQIESIPKNKKVIIFLDELPWLASRKSGLIPALEYYWNLKWSRMPKLILVVCGSAASWMLENIIYAKGGLYNRLTKKILLEPFSLKETKEFLAARNVNLTHRQVLDLYMAIGGIPFYLKEAKRGESSAQVINKLCFEKNGILYSEFANLFRSLFEQAEINLQIVRAIAKAGNSLSRERIIEVTGLSSGGTLNKRLLELEASEFIRLFVPLGKNIRDRFYRIVDEYTLFYLKWIDPSIRTGTHAQKKSQWQKLIKTSEKAVWAGHAFESVCFKHIDQIIKHLDLEDLNYKSGSWLYHPPKKTKKRGAQIDLLIDRDDNVITLCEIKYSDHQFLVDKNYASALNNKIEVVEQNYPNRKTPTKKQIFLAMVTTYGLKRNMYSEDLVHSEVTLDDLFR